MATTSRATAGPVASLTCDSLIPASELNSTCPQPTPQNYGNAATAIKTNTKAAVATCSSTVRSFDRQALERRGVNIASAAALKDRARS